MNKKCVALTEEQYKESISLIRSGFKLDGISVRPNLHRLEVYAKEHDFEIVGSSRDIASGLTLEHRLGLLDFHHAAVDGEVDILLITDLARLIRDIDRGIQY